MISEKSYCDVILKIALAFLGVEIEKSGLYA